MATATGRIIALTRRTNSPSGNPRYNVVMILEETGRVVLQTATDSQAATVIDNYSPSNQYDSQAHIKVTLDDMNRITHIEAV